MKAITFRFLLVLVVFCFLMLSSCSKSDPKPTEEERVSGLLQGSAWSIKNVKVDDVVLDMYANLKVTFTSGAYTSVNGGAIWPASGTWKFKDESATAMIREDNLEIGIQNIDETSLTITFTWKDDVFAEEGRTGAVSGKHVMVLGR